jgi:hypothetical protein
MLFVTHADRQAHTTQPLIITKTIRYEYSAGNKQAMSAGRDFTQNHIAREDMTKEGEEKEEETQRRRGLLIYEGEENSE